MAKGSTSGLFESGAAESSVADEHASVPARHCAGKTGKRPKGPPSLEALGVPEDRVAALHECEQGIRDLCRRDTGQAFELGALLAKAKTACGSQELWAAWAKKRCGISRRSADNHVNVHERLGEHRDLLVEHAVQRVTMYLLAGASSDKAGIVIARIREGNAPSVAEVRKIVAEEIVKPARRGTADLPGPDGIRALVRDRVQSAVPAFANELVAMLKVVRTSLRMQRAGQRLSKGGIASAIEHPARCARVELLGLAGGFDPNSANAVWRSEVLPFPADSGWGRLAKILLTIGSREHWPKEQDLHAWLEGEVEPTLSWAVGPKLLAAVDADGGNGEDSSLRHMTGFERRQEKRRTEEHRLAIRRAPGLPGSRTPAPQNS